MKFYGVFAINESDIKALFNIPLFCTNVWEEDSEKCKSIIMQRRHTEKRVKMRENLHDEFCLHCLRFLVKRGQKVSQHTQSSDRMKKIHLENHFSSLSSNSTSKEKEMPVDQPCISNILTVCCVLYLIHALC